VSLKALLTTSATSAKSLSSDSVNSSWDNVGLSVILLVDKDRGLLPLPGGSLSLEADFFVGAITLPRSGAGFGFY